MKRLCLVLFLFFVPLTMFAEGLTGIYGIEFGMSSKDVKSAMSEKGWRLSKDTGTTLCYEKRNGTYANLKVNDIKFEFFEDQFYGVLISFRMGTKNDDIIDSVKAIQETYNLSYISDNERKVNGVDVITYKYVDPNMNSFEFTIMGKGTVSMSLFALTNSEIYNKKKAIDEKKKEEETKKKNKSISSDL